MEIFSKEGGINLKRIIDFNIKANIVTDIDKEFTHATQNHPKFNSRHEAYAVLEEEFLELRDEVFKNHTKTPEAKIRQRKEAVQVAAMAMRFIYDCCDEGTSEKW